MIGAAAAHGPDRQLLGCCLLGTVFDAAADDLRPHPITPDLARPVNTGEEAAIRHTSAFVRRQLVFNPQHEKFQARTIWSLSNASTAAFRELDPIPEFRATAKLGGSNPEFPDCASGSSIHLHCALSFVARSFAVVGKLGNLLPEPERGTAL